MTSLSLVVVAWTSTEMSSGTRVPMTSSFPTRMRTSNLSPSLSCATSVATNVTLNKDLNLLLPLVVGRMEDTATHGANDNAVVTTTMSMMMDVENIDAAADDNDD